jgi:hypothetical protein
MRHYHRRADEAFRSRIPIPAAPFRLDWQSPLLALGSCFAREVCGILAADGLPVERNPLGTVYHPAPLAEQLQRFADKRFFRREDLVECDRGWASLQAHGQFAARDAAVALESLNQAVGAGAEAYTDARVLVLALGSAWCYRLRETGRAVANCHRMGAGLFDRVCSGVDEVVAVLDPVMRRFLEGRPDRAVVLTVSPVRHLRDNARENTLSKAVLHLAVDRLCNAGSGVHYFPAWELMMDELRDYRFYTEDLAHPAPIAVEYISHRFAEAWLSPETLVLLEELAAVRTALEHRPTEPGSAIYGRFLAQQRERLAQITRTWPGARLDRFEQRLATLEQLHFPGSLHPDGTHHTREERP